MDYEVFVLSRMREEYDETGSTNEAVVNALSRTGRLVTSAAVILCSSFASITLAPDVDIRVLAFGPAVGILLDATVIRSLLVPALVTLFGRWNWWMPAGLEPMLRVTLEDADTARHLGYVVVPSIATTTRGVPRRRATSVHPVEVSRLLRQGGVPEFPRREVLETLARYYHHLEGEHERDEPESTRRRRHDQQLLEVREEFERLLQEWVPDEELQEAWRAYLRHRAPEPDGPPPIRSVAFRGVSEVSGSVVEVYEQGRDEFEVLVDGAPIGRVAAEKDFATTVPPLHFRIGHTEFEETFSASSEARAALDALRRGDVDAPPWEYATELLADGLIDVHFALTPRGRRAPG
jgi:hypothetical protein